MRINVYAEELTNRVEIITKEVEGKTFYGARLYLYFPGQGPYIHREGDDDSSAVTFWVPWTQKKGNDFTALIHTLGLVVQKLIDAEAVAERVKAMK
jgi:hypothetical protein